LHTGLETWISYEKKEIRVQVTNTSFLLRRSQDLLDQLLFYFEPMTKLSDQQAVNLSDIKSTISTAAMFSNCVLIRSNLYKMCMPVYSWYVYQILYA
jgi:hypothetical protein